MFTKVSVAAVGHLYTSSPFLWGMLAEDWAVSHEWVGCVPPHEYLL